MATVLFWIWFLFGVSGGQEAGGCRMEVTTFDGVYVQRTTCAAARPAAIRGRAR